jgi:DNA-binding transcriptional LysR family regulator
MPIHNQTPTEAGRLYLEGCKRALEAVDAADAIVAETAQEPRGTLRITAPVEIGAAVLTPKLPAFLSIYPEVTIELVLDDRVIDLVAENFDVCIRIGKLPDSGLIARPLNPFRLVTCASPDYLERHGVPQVPDDLLEHACVDYAFHNYPAPSNWTFTEVDGEQRQIQPVARLTVNNGHALVEAVLAGGGIIRASELAVARYLETGRLVPILREFASGDRPMHIVYPGQRIRLPKLRAFVDWAIKSIPPHGRA